MSTIAVFREAWRNRDKLGDANQTRELAAFLPAALEIQESPPNPLARWLAWSTLSLVVIAITWALLGHVNIVASAEGKIIPSSRVKQVQPLEKGVVKALLVSEGEYVKQGQPLIELDTTLTQADEKRQESELHSARLRLAVSRSMLNLLAETDQPVSLSYVDTYPIDLPANTTVHEVALHKSLLKQQWLQYQSQLSVLHSGLAKTRAEQAATREVIAKLKQTLPIAEKRAATLKSLHGKDFVSENDYLTVEQERIQQVQDLAAERQHLKQLQAAEAEVHEQINLHKAQTSGTLLNDITELQRQIAVLEEEFAKASDLNAKQVLYSPVAGRVQELAINTVGGVVTEAQQLMLVVPDEEQLEVEVFLENNDIGFVQEGMPAEIKIHTFPFTKYGVIDAEVTNVSDDATVDEQRGLIYRMQLRMSKNTLWVEGKEVKLQPGMAVTTEVQTGERKIIEFFLAPLLRYKDESIRER
jgi:hemolysin D